MIICMSLIFHSMMMLSMGKTIKINCQIASQGIVPHMTTDGTFKPLPNPTNPSHNDAIINKFKNKPISFKDDLGWKTSTRMWSWSLHSLKHFQLQRIKTNSRRVLWGVNSRSLCYLYGFIKGAKSFSIRELCQNKLTRSSTSGKTITLDDVLGVSDILKNLIFWDISYLNMEMDFGSDKFILPRMACLLAKTIFHLHV